MAGFERRRGALAISAATMLIFSVAASAVGATYLYSSGIISNNEPPRAQIASLVDGEVLPTGSIEVKGSAADDDAIQAVSVRVDGGSPVSAIPDSMNDFSGWTVSLDLSPGNHTIEVETIDDLGKTNSTKISVMVTDAAMTAPADKTVEATGSSGALVSYPLPSVQKDIRAVGGPDCLPAPGSMFPIGTTTVTCTVSFAGGNTAAADFVVSVGDSMPPTIVAPPSVTVENSGVAYIKVSLGKPVVNDIVDANPEVSNNAPANGFALGTTTVVWTASDDYGNTATAKQKVTVTPADDGGSTSSDGSGGGSTTYFGGGGGGGGGGSGSSNKEQGEDEKDAGEDDDGDESGSAPATHTLIINGADLSGSSISVSATIKAVNGTTLQTGNTPLTFAGTDATYTVTVVDSDDATFDHWENEATTLEREVTLNQDTTLTAYYNSSVTSSDTIAPTVTASPPGGTYSSTQSVTLIASETATIYYTTNGGAPTTSSTTYSSPITIDLTTTLKYFARDVVGNSGSIVTQTYTINAADTTDPSVAITDPAEDSEVAATDGEIVVSGIALDSGSGIELVEVRVDDGDYVEATPAATGDWSTWSVTLPITAGERRLVPRATDNAGNQAWNSIYVTITDPSSGGGDSGGDTGTLDQFGIERVYPTVAGGNEWYVNMDDPKSDPNFRNLPSMTKQSDGSWQVSANQVRMEAWSPSGEKWLNVEITMYAKMVGGSNELVQLYSRGGHHFSDSNKWCEGSAYKARLYGDGEARWVKEVMHPSYTGNRGSVQATDTPLMDRWVGFKAVIYNFVENGKTYVRLENYIDDDVTDSNGNLVIGNNWELASVVEDKGGWSTSNSDFDPTCAPLNMDGTEQYRQRDEILNLPGGTSTQNIAAFRSDSLTWNWKYLTVREIVAP